MNKIKNIIGIFLVAFGLLFNKLILGAFSLSGDMYILRDKLPNPLVSIVCLATGLFLQV